MWSPDLAKFGHNARSSSFASVTQRVDTAFPKSVSVQPPTADPNFTFTRVKLNLI